MSLEQHGRDMVLCVRVLDGVEYFEYGTRRKGSLGSITETQVRGSVSHDYELFLWTLGLASEVLVEMNITSFAWRGTHGIRLRAIDPYNRA